MLTRSTKSLGIMAVLVMSGMLATTACAVNRGSTGATPTPPGAATPPAAGIPGVKTLSTATQPGGVWVTHDDGKPKLSFDMRARAYPTNPGDPAIDYVNFTITINGNWVVACRASSPVSGDTYECKFSPSDMDHTAKPGEFQASFDVYNKAGIKNLAPNGPQKLYLIDTN